MAIAITIAAILVAAVAFVLLTRGRPRPGVGSAASATSRDVADAARATVSAEAIAGGRSEDESAEARARAGDARAVASGTATFESAAASRAPLSEEELGVTRRQFFNRGILAGIYFATVSLGAASLAFIWPSLKGGGFGGKINAGKLTDIFAAIDLKSAPFYVPEARSYVERYPAEALPAARKAKYPAVILRNLEAGFVVENQKCPHLGCRVPWCATSQWFECPCHGSKYNRVGEKRDGPAPRGLSLVAAEVVDGDLVINTGIIVPGMAIGTDTTKQRPEGPSCI